MAAKVLKLGSAGDDVRRLQRALARNGYPVPVNGVYGEETEGAVELFQASHLDRDGHPLGVDGEVSVGWRWTWWALMSAGRGQVQAGPPATAKAAWASLHGTGLAGRRLDVLRVACTEVGVEEEPDGSNTGPRVKDYLDGWTPPPPWCALFVSWCLRRAAGGDEKKALAFPPHRSRASVTKIAAWGAANGKLRREPRFAGKQAEVLASCDDVSEPRAGDMFLMLRAGAEGVDSGRGHTGFVLAVEPDHVVTVEGNCANAVRCRRRLRADLAGYVAVLP